MTGTIKDFQIAHDSGDTDFEPSSIHHTIGEGSNQAASGNHNHDLYHAKQAHNVELHEGFFATYQDGTPVGAIIMWPVASNDPLLLPTNWLVCDGSTFTGADFPELRDLLGDTFGVHVGDAYKLPDFRDRFPLGKAAATTVGNTGGAFSRLLAKINIPPHVHSISHSHTASSRPLTGALTSILAQGGGTAAIVQNTAVQAPVPTSSGDASGDGLGSQPVDITNPYLVIKFLIKSKRTPAVD